MGVDRKRKSEGAPRNRLTCFEHFTQQLAPALGTPLPSAPRETDEQNKNKEFDNQTISRAVELIKAANVNYV